MSVVEKLAVVFGPDKEEGKQVEDNTNPKAKKKRNRLELEETDLETQADIRKEHLATMRWFWWARMIVAIVATVVPVGMLWWLGKSLHNPCFGKFFYDSGVDMWVKIVVISGTFLTFILVFGGLVKGVFATSRSEDKRETKLEEMVGLIAKNFSDAA